MDAAAAGRRGVCGGARIQLETGGIPASGAGARDEASRMGADVEQAPPVARQAPLELSEHRVEDPIFVRGVMLPLDPLGGPALVVHAIEIPRERRQARG